MALKLGLTALRRNRMRTLLTILAMIIGVAAVISDRRAALRLTDRQHRATTLSLPGHKFQTRDTVRRHRVGASVPSCLHVVP